MQLGNSIELIEPEDLKAKLFKIDSIKAFKNCLSTLAHHVRQKSRKHVLIISDEKYRYEKVRMAYFAWLNEEYGRAGHNGDSVQTMHTKYKATYLLPILSRENTDFADLVLKVTKSGESDKAIVNLLSVADGSIVTTAILKEYFTACQVGG